MAAIIVGTLMLTIFHWAGPSHTFFGENWVYVLQVPIIVVGTMLILIGFWMVSRVLFDLVTTNNMSATLEFSRSR